MGCDAMTDETKKIIADYLKGCRTQAPEYQDAVQRITAMTFMSPPELQWEVILEAVRQAEDDNDLGHIAAGPIEGFLGWHGKDWIEQVELEASRNFKFARAVTGVWKYMMNDALWKRVEQIKSSVPFNNRLSAR